jgi:hypothetical protein
LGEAVPSPLRCGVGRGRWWSARGSTALRYAHHEREGVSVRIGMVRVCCAPTVWRGVWVGPEGASMGR